MRRQALDQILRRDAADPHGERERDRRERHAQREPHGVIREAVGQVPTEEAEHGIDEGGDGPLDHLVADMPRELGQVVRGGPGAPDAAQIRDVVEHALVPAGVLANHAGRRLRHVHHLEHRHGRHENATGAQRVAERRILRGARGREAADVLQRVETHELVVAETDLRAAEAEVEEGSQSAGRARCPGREPRKQLEAAALIDQPRDRDADEDGRLLHGAHAAADVEPVEVGQRERHALIGEASAVAGQIGGDPAIDVRIGDRVGVAQADPDARGIVPEVEQGLEHLGPEGPVELVGLSPLAWHRGEREHLLLPGR